MGNYDGFSKYLLGFVKIPLSYVSYVWSAHVIPTGIKANHTHKGLDEDLVFCDTLRFNMILHESSPNT